MANKGQFQKGHKGGPGRDPAILPEVRRAIDANRNTAKIQILQEIEPHFVEWVRNIIKQGKAEGDVVRFKTLLEIALGKMVEDAPQFPVDEQEKILVLEYRRRKRESGTQPGNAQPGSGTASDQSATEIQT